MKFPFSRLREKNLSYFWRSRLLSVYNYTMRDGQKTTRELLSIYLGNAEHNQLTICNLIKISKFIEDS